MIPEGLIEEWSDDLANSLRLYLPPSEKAPPDQYERVAKRVLIAYITLTAQAIARGEMKLADEVGRIERINWWTDIQEWIERMCEKAKGQVTLIAIRQEEGTKND